MSAAVYHVGDVFDVLATIPTGSVDLVMSSPPFIGLRAYLPADHRDKGKEIGSEPTPAVFISTLLDVCAELRRVLAPHGSICIELGDTMAGSGGAGGDYDTEGMRDGQARFTGSAARSRAGGERRLAGHGAGWPLDKSKACIPELFRVALAYGIHPLTGQPSPAGQWRVRNVVTWARTNPPVGALGDKWRPATSDIVIACTATDRYWDEVATRVPASTGTNARTATGVDRKAATGKTADARRGNYGSLDSQHTSGTTAPLRDWWVINNRGTSHDHFATYPPELCVAPIQAMCPHWVCTECGEPQRPIVESTSTGQNTRTSRGMADDPRQIGAVVSTDVPECSDKRIVGWTNCGHDKKLLRRGVVLDPFAGTGTTLQVATGAGRDAIGIDIDDRNADYAAEKLGMFLTVTHRTEQVPA